MKLKIILSVILLLMMSMLFSLSLNHIVTVPSSTMAVAQLNGGNIERSTLDVVSNKQKASQVIVVVMGTLLMVSVWKPKKKKEIK